MRPFTQNANTATMIIELAVASVPDCVSGVDSVYVATRGTWCSAWTTWTGLFKSLRAWR